MTTHATRSERWLWASVVVVVVLIYSSIALAQTLAQELQDRELVSTAIWLGLWVLVAAIIVLGLGTRPSWLAAGAILGIIGVYALVMTRMAIPEERSHIVEYGMVGALIYAALQARIAGGRHVPMPAVLAIAATAVIGAIDEFIQLALPERVFDVRDIAFNAFAGFLAVSAVAILSWIKKRASMGRSDSP